MAFLTGRRSSRWTRTATKAHDGIMVHTLAPVASPFRYGGQTIAEWLPVIVERIADEFRPVRITLFGSLARGDADRDSDIDLLVELTSVADPASAAATIRAAISDIPAPVDVFVTDAARIRRRGNAPGSVLAAALREGIVVHERG